jgi:hypothetical protein
MNREMKIQIRDTWCRGIARSNGNPATWLTVVRHAAMALGLDVTRCIPLGVSLQLVADEVIGEAEKQGRSDEQIRAALIWREP